MNTLDKIDEIGKAILSLLKYKNTLYGDAWKAENSVFSKGSCTDSIRVRLDDKLSRIRNNKEDMCRTNDVVDIIGYLILLLIAQDTKKEEIEALMD